MPEDKFKLARHVYDINGGEKEFGTYERYIKAIADTKFQNYIYDNYGQENVFGPKDRFMKVIYPTPEESLLQKPNQTLTEILEPNKPNDANLPYVINAPMGSFDIGTGSELYLKRDKQPTKEQKELVKQFAPEEMQTAFNKIVAKYPASQTGPEQLTSHYEPDWHKVEDSREVEDIITLSGKRKKVLEHNIEFKNKQFEWDNAMGEGISQGFEQNLYLLTGLGKESFDVSVAEATQMYEAGFLTNDEYKPYVDRIRDYEFTKDATAAFTNTVMIMAELYLTRGMGKGKMPNVFSKQFFKHFVTKQGFKEYAKLLHSGGKGSFKLMGYGATVRAIDEIKESNDPSQIPFILAKNWAEAYLEGASEYVIGELPVAKSFIRDFFKRTTLGAVFETSTEQLTDIFQDLTEGTNVSIPMSLLRTGGITAEAGKQVLIELIVGGGLGGVMSTIQGASLKRLEKKYGKATVGVIREWVDGNMNQLKQNFHKVAQNKFSKLDEIKANQSVSTALNTLVAFANINSEDIQKEKDETGENGSAHLQGLENIIRLENDTNEFVETSNSSNELEVMLVRGHQNMLNYMEGIGKTEEFSAFKKMFPFITDLVGKDAKSELTSISKTILSNINQLLATDKQANLTLNEAILNENAQFLEDIAKLPQNQRNELRAAEFVKLVANEKIVDRRSLGIYAEAIAEGSTEFNKNATLFELPKVSNKNIIDKLVKYEEVSNIKLPENEYGIVPNKDDKVLMYAKDKIKSEKLKKFVTDLLIAKGYKLDKVDFVPPKPKPTIKPKAENKTVDEVIETDEVQEELDEIEELKDNVDDVKLKNVLQTLTDSKKEVEYLEEDPFENVFDNPLHELEGPLTETEYIESQLSEESKVKAEGAKEALTKNELAEGDVVEKDGKKGIVKISSTGNIYINGELKTEEELKDYNPIDVDEESDFGYIPLSARNLSTPKKAFKIFNTNKEYSFDEVIKEAGRIWSPRQRKIIDYINNHTDTKVKFARSQEDRIFLMDDQISKIASYQGNTVYLDGNLKWSKSLFKIALLHEGTHALTDSLLATNPEFATEINNIMNKFNAYLEKDEVWSKNDLTKLQQIHMSSPKEFLAGVFSSSIDKLDNQTNITIMRLMKQIIDSENGNLWDRFLNAIKTGIAVVTGYTPDSSLLGQIDKAVAEVLNTADTLIPVLNNRSFLPGYDKVEDGIYMLKDDKGSTKKITVQNGMVALGDLPKNAIAFFNDLTKENITIEKVGEIAPKLGVSLSNLVSSVSRSATEEEKSKRTTISQLDAIFGTSQNEGDDNRFDTNLFSFFKNPEILQAAGERSIGHITAELLGKKVSNENYFDFLKELSFDDFIIIYKTLQQPRSNDTELEKRVRLSLETEYRSRELTGVIPFQEFILLKLTRLYSRLHSMNRRHVLNVTTKQEFTEEGRKWRIDGVEKLEGDFVGNNGAIMTDIKTDILLDEMLDDLQELLGTEIEIAFINGFKDISTGIIKPFQSANDFNINSITKTLLRNGYIPLNIFADKHTLPVLFIKEGIDSIKGMDQVEGLYQFYKKLWTDQGVEVQDGEVSDIITSTLRAFVEDNKLRPKSVAQVLAGDTSLLKDGKPRSMIDLMKRAYLVKENWKITYHDIIMKILNLPEENLEEGNSPIFTMTDEQGNQRVFARVVILDSTTFGMSISGKPLLDGEAISAMSGFGRTLRYLTGIMQKGTLKTWYAGRMLSENPDKPFNDNVFLKMAVHEKGKEITKVGEDRIKSFWELMNDNGIGIILNHTLEKNGTFPIDRLVTMEQLEKGEVADKRFAIPIDNFKYEKETGKVEVTARGLMQFLFTKGLSVNNPMIENSKLHEGVEHMIDYLIKRVASKIKYFRTNSDIIIKHIKDYAYNAPSPTHRTIYQLLSRQFVKSEVDETGKTVVKELSDRDIANNIEGIFDHPYMAKGLNEELHNIVIDVLKGESIGSTPVVTADVGNRSPGTIEAIRKGIRLSGIINDAPELLDVYHKSPEYRDNGLAVEESRRHLATIKQQLRDKLDSNGYISAKKEGELKVEIAKLSDQIKRLKKERDSFIKEHGKPNWNATSWNNYVEREEKKIINENGFLKGNYVIIGKSMADGLAARPGDRALVNIVPSTNLSQTFPVRVAGVVNDLNTIQSDGMYNKGIIVFSNDFIQARGRDFDIDVTGFFVKNSQAFNEKQWNEFLDAVEEMDIKYAEQLYEQIKAKTKGIVELPKLETTDRGFERLAKLESIIQAPKYSAAFMQEVLGSKIYNEDAPFVGKEASNLGDEYNRNIGEITTLQTVSTIVNATGMNIEFGSFSSKKTDSEFTEEVTVHTVGANHRLDYPNDPSMATYNNDSNVLWARALGMDKYYSENRTKQYRAVFEFLFEKAIALPREVKVRSNEKRSLQATIDYIRDIKKMLDMLDNRDNPAVLEKLQQEFLLWIASNDNIQFQESNSNFNKEQLVNLATKVFNPTLLKFDNLNAYPLFRMIKSFPIDFISDNVYGHSEYKYRSVETEINNELSKTVMIQAHEVMDQFLKASLNQVDNKTKPNNLLTNIFNIPGTKLSNSDSINKLFGAAGIVNSNLNETQQGKSVIDQNMDKALINADSIINNYSWQNYHDIDITNRARNIELGNRKGLHTFRHEIRYLINAIDEKLLDFTDTFVRPPRETKKLTPSWYIRRNENRGKRSGPPINETTWPILWQELIKKNLFSFQPTASNDLKFNLGYKSETIEITRLPSDNIGVIINEEIIPLSNIKPGTHKLGEFDLYDLFTSEEGFWNDHTQTSNPNNYVGYKNVGDYNRVVMSLMISLRQSLSDSKRIELTMAWINKNLDNGRVTSQELKMIFTSFIGNVHKSKRQNVEDFGYDGTTSFKTPNLVLHKAYFDSQEGYPYNSILMQLMNEFDETLSDQYIELYNKYSKVEKDISFFPVGTDYLSTQKKYTARYRVMNTDQSVKQDTNEFKRILKKDGVAGALEHFTRYLNDLGFYSYLHYTDGKELLYDTIELFEANIETIKDKNQMFIQLADVDMLLTSVGIDPNNISTAKEKRLVLLFNNLSKVKNSFRNTSQSKMAHLLPIDVYSDLYGIQYLTPGVFLNRFLPQLLVIPDNIEQRIIKSDDVINWIQQIFPQAYTTGVIGNAGVEKFMMDKIQEHVLALQRDLGISLKELSDVKDHMYNNILGAFAFQDESGKQVFYGKNTSGRAQMEKDILKLAQTGFRGLENQPDDGLFAPGEYSHLGIEQRKTDEGLLYYVYKNLRTGKEFSDKALFIDDVFLDKKYAKTSDTILNYKKNAFDAALIIRRFFDLQIHNILSNSVEYLNSHANILKTINQDGITAKVVNGLSFKWSKIRDEILQYNNDPSHDYSFTPHAWNHEDFEQLYKVKRYEQVRTLFNKNKERVKKEGAVNSAEQFLLNTNESELQELIDEFMNEELARILASPRNNKLVYAGEYNKMRVDFEEGFITSLEMITSYSDTIMDNLKDDLIKTNYHMFMSTAGRMGEKYETVQTIRRFYYNELRDKNFAADYIKKSDIKIGDEVNFNLFGTWTSVKGYRYRSENMFWGKVVGFTSVDGKKALKLKHHSSEKPIPVPLDEIYTRDHGQNKLENHIKVFREKGIAESYDYWARESGFSKEHRVMDWFAKAFIHAPRRASRLVTYLHLGTLLQLFAGLKNLIGGGSSNLMGSPINYFAYWQKGKAWEKKIKSKKDVVTKEDRGILLALDELALSTASNNHVMNAALQGDMDIDFSMLDISPSKRETIKALWTMWRDKSGFTQYKKSKRELQDQYNRASTLQHKNEILEEIRQLEQEWLQKKNELATDGTFSQESAERQIAELEKGNLNEILNMDSKLAGKLLKKYLTAYFNFKSFEYFLKPEPWLRRTAFFIGYFDALEAGMQHEQALTHGKLRSGVNHAHYGPKDRLVGATNEWGIALTKFIQYGVRHFAKTFHQLKQAKAQVQLHGHRMPFSHYLESEELVPFTVLTNDIEEESTREKTGLILRPNVKVGVNLNKIMAATVFQSIVMQYMLKYMGFYSVANLGDPFVQWVTGLIELVFDLISGEPPDELDRGQAALFISHLIPIAGWGTTAPFMMLNEEVLESFFGKKNIEIIRNMLDVISGNAPFDPANILGIERSFYTIYESFYDW